MIANMNIDDIRNNAEKIKGITEEMTLEMENILKVSGVEDITMPKPPNWGTASVDEINQYYEKTVKTFDEILNDKRVARHDATVLNKNAQSIENEAVNSNESTHDGKVYSPETTQAPAPVANPATTQGKTSVEVGDVFKGVTTGNTLRTDAETAENTDVTNINVDNTDNDILTLSHNENVYSLFKDSQKVIKGVDIITDGKVAIPYSEQALSEIKKVYKGTIAENENISLAKLYHKDNPVVIQGNPKVCEAIVQGEHQEAYAFIIDGRVHSCLQNLLMRSIAMVIQ